MIICMPYTRVVGVRFSKGSAQPVIGPCAASFPISLSFAISPSLFTTITDGYEPFPAGGGSKNMFVSESEPPALQLNIYALYG